MFKKLTDAAQSLKERADVGEKLEATKQFASSKYEAGKTGASAAWEKHWPTIEGVLVEGLLSIAEEKLRDDKTLESALIKLYETLPLAVRLVLSRDRFLELTMARRDPLLLKVQNARAERSSQTSLPKLEAPKKSDV